MSKKIIPLLACLATLFVAVASFAQLSDSKWGMEHPAPLHNNRYIAHWGPQSTNPGINVDANLDDWDNEPFIKGLTAPWSGNIKDQTIFDYKVVDNYFYFYFKTVDKTPNVAHPANEHDNPQGDKVEIYFSPTWDLQDYYCLEINPEGLAIDFHANFYLKLDKDWDFRTKKIAASKTKDGYIVEGRIALRELKRLGIKDEFYLGVFRADFIDPDKGKVIWYTWAIPKCKDPSFHVSSAFKKFNLDDVK